MINIQRKAIAVVGEGITEKYYIESLKGLTPFQIHPRELNKNASSLKKLEENIQELINIGYDEVYCLIDMDGKDAGKSLIDYLKIKNKYHGKIHERKKQGIKCNVIFIETERCIELWFLFHFLNNGTTKKFNSYNELERELKKYLPRYEKTEKYFRAVINLHKELNKKVAPSGSLINAIKNSKQSIDSKIKDGRNYTYCEMHILIEALGI